MKSFIALVLLMSLSTAALAQNPVEDQIALVRQAAHTDRKVLIMGNVHFTSGESERFWPEWQQYRVKMAANGDRVLALIQDFAAHYNEMTDQKATALLTDSFSINMQKVVIKQDFAHKINAFLPAKKVMRIIQIENKLDAAIDMKLAAEIPLAK